MNKTDRHCFPKSRLLSFRFNCPGTLLPSGPSQASAQPLRFCSGRETDDAGLTQSCFVWFPQCCSVPSVKEIELPLVKIQGIFLKLQISRFLNIGRSRNSEPHCPLQQFAPFREGFCSPEFSSFLVTWVFLYWSSLVVFITCLVSVDN